MPRRRIATLLTGIGALAASALLLVGCATVPAADPAPFDAGATPGAPASEVDAAWLDSGRMIGVVTQGSSSCVPQADDVSVDGQTITVSLTDPEGAACTRDFVPRVTLIPTPESIDVAEDVVIVTTGAVEGQGELDGSDGLAGASGESTDYLPSAGWTGVDGQFVVLSWGSSSCAPVVEDAVASGEADVTVTFQTPPEDQICTMDMGPRAVVIQVAGLDEDDAFAVLTGTPEFDGVRVPILD